MLTLLGKDRSKHQFLVHDIIRNIPCHDLFIPANQSDSELRVVLQVSGAVRYSLSPYWALRYPRKSDFPARSWCAQNADDGHASSRLLMGLSKEA